VVARGAHEIKHNAEKKVGIPLANNEEDQLRLDARVVGRHSLEDLIDSSPDSCALAFSDRLELAFAHAVAEHDDALRRHLVLDNEVTESLDHHVIHAILEPCVSVRSQDETEISHDDFGSRLLDCRAGFVSRKVLIKRPHQGRQRRPIENTRT
jgi:hypothetical protein